MNGPCYVREAMDKNIFVVVPVLLSRQFLLEIENLRSALGGAGAEMSNHLLSPRLQSGTDSSVP